MMHRYAMSMPISPSKSFANSGIISTSDKKSKENNITVDLGGDESLHFALDAVQGMMNETLFTLPFESGNKSLQKHWQL